MSEFVTRLKALKRAGYPVEPIDAYEMTEAVEWMADEIERLQDGLDAIRQYGSDTLRGPSKLTDDTRDWQRDCVLEMTNRAVRVLGGKPWLGQDQQAE